MAGPVFGSILGGYVRLAGWRWVFQRFLVCRKYPSYVWLTLGLHIDGSLER
jgi:hypothetical protein